MKNIYKFSNKNIVKARGYLKKNMILALPTETVYGLAGNAYSTKAVKKIYKLKKRPNTNPLIVHYNNIETAKKDIIINKNFLKLYKTLSPGPITYILKKRRNSQLSKFSTANLETVAIRFPKHRAVKKLLAHLDFPLAMPSANISKSVSPTDALAVFDEFGYKLNFILDAGRTKHGIESTIINLVGKPVVLRYGVIAISKIEKILKLKIKKNKTIKKIISPGQLKKHYSPGIPIYLNMKKYHKDAAFIAFGKNLKKGKNIFNLSKHANLKTAAKNLYYILRKIKKLKFKKIFITKIPNENIGLAINDRIKRASKK